MHDAVAPIPFGQRLQTLLANHEPPITQAWLADRSGLDRSLVSRIINGQRSPTSEALQCVAPALGIELAELVRGTDAEARLQDTSNSVQAEDYALAIQKVVEYEGRAREIELQLGAAREALAQEEERRKRVERAVFDAQLERERAQRDLETACARNRRQEQELRRYQSALSKAVAELTSLRAQLRELSQELALTKKSSRAASILAGVAAVTGVATVAHFLSGSGDELDSEIAEEPPASRHEQRKRS